MSETQQRNLWVFVAAVVVLAIALAWLLPFEDLFRNPITFILLLGLSAVAGRWPIRISTLRTAISASDPFLFASLVVLGGLPSVLVGMAGTLSSAIGTGIRFGAQKLVFNLAAAAAAISAASLTFESFSYGTGEGLQRVFPLAAAATVYFLVLTLLIAGVIAIDRREPFVSTWFKSGPWTAVTTYCAMTLGFVLLVALDFVGPAGLVLGIPPLWLFVAYFRSHRDRLKEQQRRMEQILESNQRLEEQVRARTAQLASKVEELERAREHLRHLANTDELTLLPNRRCFKQHLAREIARGERFHHPVALLLIDIDHFKRVNDRYGHAMGDLVLQQLATAIDSSVRRTDLAGRYGGEEFGIVLAETRKAGATILAEQLCASIGAMTFGPDDQTGPERVTVSIGVAAFPDDAENLDDLIEAADRRLYDAKEEGRDRVIA